MSNNFKYTFEKHKNKILVGSSMVLFSGIGVSSYFLFTDHEFGKSGEEQQLENHLADYILSGRENGELSLIDIDKGEVKDTVSLPQGNYLYSSNTGYDTVYAYNGKEIYAYKLNRGKFVKQGQIAKIEVEGATDFKVKENNIAILSNQGQTLTYQYEIDKKLKTKVIELQDTVTDFHISKGILTYSSNTNLHTFSPTSEKTIDLGDETDVITTFQNRLLIQNNFGSGVNNNILVTLNNKNLKIQQVEETKSADTKILSMDSDDKVFYTTQYVSSSEPYHLLDEWKIEDGKIVKFEDVNIKIPVKKDGVVYDHETSVASAGYLYTKINDKVQFFDILSHDFLKNIAVDDYFVMPVLTE